MFSNSKIDNYIHDSIKNHQLELEIVYGCRDNLYNMIKNINNDDKRFTSSDSKLGYRELKRHDFVRLIEYCKENYKSNRIINQLDINFTGENSKIRATIDGIQSIKKYCNDNDIQNISDISFMEKVKYKNPLRDYNYNIRLNLKKENQLSNDDSSIINIKENYKSLFKFYRYKKRFSFETKNQLFRIDLTIIKSNKRKF